MTRFLQVLRILIVLVVIAAVGYAVVKDWAAVSETIGRLNPLLLLGSFLAAFAGVASAVAVWRGIIGHFGAAIAPIHAGEIYLVGQLARYVPGSVWAFVLQAQLGKRHRVPRLLSLLSLLTTVGIIASTGMILAILGVPLYVTHWGNAAYLLFLAPLSLVALAPPVLSYILNFALRLMRRPPLTRPVDLRMVITASAWAVLQWLFFGLHLWLLFLGAPSARSLSYPEALATFALAVCAGFVAFLLPSGVGIREAIIVAGATALMPSGVALAIALVSRLLCTAADVIAAGLAAGLSRTFERRHRVTRQAD